MKKQNQKKNQGGFIVADFLFSFVLVIGVGMIIFGLTFSLMTIEVAQYVTWSSARSYSAAGSNKESSQEAGQRKIGHLQKALPFLTEGSWFEMSKGTVGSDQQDFVKASRNNALGSESRHPWSGTTATLKLKLFSSLKIPLLGKISDADTFDMPINAFILRNPSADECQNFYDNRYMQGISQVDDLKFEKAIPESYISIEDNGC